MIIVDRRSPILTKPTPPPKKKTLGGGAIPPPSEISETTGPTSKIQTLYDSPAHEFSEQGRKFDPKVIEDVTGQVS